jgi:Domain of unknown function (DUF4112)
MAMSDDDIFVSPTARPRKSSGPRFGGVSAHGPVIDQEGREIPEETLGARFRDTGFEDARFGGFRFDFTPLTHEQRLARLEALAKLLDIAFVLPGTNIRYGIDGIIGLIPVVGDVIVTALSLWLVREARALGAPWHLTTRMLANVGLQGVAGMVPVAGNAFDVLFRANVRNALLLRRWIERQAR